MKGIILGTGYIFWAFYNCWTISQCCSYYAVNRYALNVNTWSSIVAIGSSSVNSCHVNVDTNVVINESICSWGSSLVNDHNVKLQVQVLTCAAKC